MNSDRAAKWGCIIAAAILTFVAAIFDAKSKESIYTDIIREEVGKRLDGKK